MVLANPAKKASASLGSEGGSIFFIFIIVVVALLGIIFDPKGVASVVAPVGQSFASPALAFVHGIYNFFMALFTGIVNKILGGITSVGSSISSVGSSISSGASSIGSDIYKNTIGRL